MIMRHEVLFLNSKRAYVRVRDTWYDTAAEFMPEIDQPFLLGKIEEVLDYESYREEYPESENEMYSYVSDKTVSGGYIRRVMDGMVKYGVNPETPTLGIRFENE